MKKCFYETKIYDYSNVEDAEKHMKEMAEKGWFADVNEYYDDDGVHLTFVYENGSDVYPYSIEYHKQH